MGLTFDNEFISTGRAKCGVCDKQIKAGDICIKVEGFRTGGQCHKTCPKE